MVDTGYFIMYVLPLNENGRYQVLHYVSVTFTWSAPLQPGSERGQPGKQGSVFSDV